MAAAYDLGRHATAVVAPEQGHSGRVWRLTTTRGRYAVKVPFARPDPAAVAADAAYQDIVRAAGVHLPAVVRTPDGDVLRELDDGTVVRVYEWVDVRPADRTLDPGAVGRAVAAIHAADVPDDRPPHPWHTEPVGVDRWRELTERALAADAPFAPRLAAHVPELVALERLLGPPGPVRRCHCDLWADNVRASASADQDVVVLDWENSGPADPVGELPMVMFDFGVRDPDRTRSLYAAYVAADGPARVTSPADCSMLIATLGHIVEIGALRWLNGTDPAEREIDAAWVAEGVDDPLTRRSVDLILGACAQVEAAGA
ncbi:aminoglycoside phosphotransferase family protein [Ornithinimicrobium cerasi]|uniref:Ser/Thr protein kinase RdoA involved in Cpx stress response, MazF antagonist n=1 Tax=Ornithinimicrobium cerasi TaxID=2248773 RepID=A0A285VZW7_9MICO|nr:aminoglycoside phosphotransferase family protein [Ornithinimicrobium cerasi]SOC58211.1 Ser/Thr protein kinase RdoA involved in Cpx stress response, MazF antagonist [Ornithinimicrobium cerasi]